MALLSAIDLLLGHAKFRELFGANADPAFLLALTQSLKALNVPQMRDPLEIRDAAARLVDDLRAARHLRE